MLNRAFTKHRLAVVATYGDKASRHNTHVNIWKQINCLKDHVLCHHSSEKLNRRSTKTWLYLLFLPLLLLLLLAYRRKIHDLSRFTFDVLVDWLIDWLWCIETGVSEPPPSLAHCSSPGWMWVEGRGDDNRDNSWLVYQSSLVVLPTEASGASRRNGRRNENFAC
jgi:hypothetical protein